MASDILSKTPEKYGSMVIDETRLGPHMLRFVDSTDKNIMMFVVIWTIAHYRNHVG